MKTLESNLPKVSFFMELQEQVKLFSQKQLQIKHPQHFWELLVQNSFKNTQEKDQN